MGDRFRLCTKPMRVHYLAATTYLHVSGTRVCAHTRQRASVCVSRGGIVYQTPSEKSPHYRLCHYSVHLAYYLSGFVCVCACVFVCMCVTCSDSDGGIQCGEFLMKTDFKGWLCHFTTQRNKKTEGRGKRQINAFTHTHANISTYKC